MSGLSRRRFIKITAATGAALLVGPPRWGWALPGSPFAELQDDPILRLPEGFSYRVIAEAGQPLIAGMGPWPRPEFPDLNVVFPQRDGRLLLSTSHEVPAGTPITPPPGEDYDRLAGGSVTSLLLNRDLSIAESAYNAGGMSTNCSGSGTPWGTVLSGEETTQTFEADHGFIWEIDPRRNVKKRLDDCGRFEHETAIVDSVTGYVYLTEDANGGLLYRMRPRKRADLASGGVLEAFSKKGEWVTIEDPKARDLSTSRQGIDKGALAFERLEGGRIDGRWLYFTETEDPTAAGKIWRLHLDNSTLELWAQGKKEVMVMPDNLTVDRGGNLFVAEDRGDTFPDEPNKIVYIDRRTGKLATFAELATPNASDEMTGPEFSPRGDVLFLNLQRGLGFGLTVAITGPFARYRSQARKGSDRAMPSAVAPPEAEAVRELELATMGLSVGAAAALVSLRRRGRIETVPSGLEDVAFQMGPPDRLPRPKVRQAKNF
jgi:uncharacterized protein